MKKILIVCEGIADIPLEELDGQTPLDVAGCVTADALAAVGRAGQLRGLGRGLVARSEVLCAMLLGVGRDEALNLYRGPVEAAGITESQGRLMTGMAKLLGFESIRLSDPWLCEKAEKPQFNIAEQEKDFVMVYVEAPYGSGRYGAPVDKIKALEDMDRFILAPLMEILRAFKPYRIGLVSDGIVSSADGRPEQGNMPFVMAGTGVIPDAVRVWNEEACAKGALGVTKAERVLGSIG